MMSTSHRVLVGALACLAPLFIACSAGADQTSCRPQLTIATPKSGATVENPLVVRYRVNCLNVRLAKPAYLRIALPGMDPAVRAVKRLNTEAGTTTVAFSKLETGQRDLRFTLLRTNRTVADSVLVADVLLTGGR